MFPAGAGVPKTRVACGLMGRPFAGSASPSPSQRQSPAHPRGRSPSPAINPNPKHAPLAEDGTRTMAGTPTSGPHTRRSPSPGAASIRSVTPTHAQPAYAHDSPASGPRQPLSASVVRGRSNSWCAPGVRDFVASTLRSSGRSGVYVCVFVLIDVLDPGGVAGGREVRRGVSLMWLFCVGLRVGGNRVRYAL